MVIVRSNIEVGYSISNPVKKAIVEIEVYKWEETFGSYIAKIQDFWIEEVTESIDDLDNLGNTTGQTEMITYEKRNLIEKRDVFLTRTQINNLASALQPYLVGLEEADRRDVLLQQGTLNFVKSDFLEDSEGNITNFLKYSTEASNWYLKT